MLTRIERSRTCRQDSCRFALTFGLLVVALILQNSIAEAFDGSRRGFFLGGGLGVASSTRQLGYRNDHAFGFQTNLAIGHGVSDKLLFGYSGLQFWGLRIISSSEEFNNATFALIPSFAGWYYFKPTYPSPYVKGGLGLAILNGTDGSGDCCDFDGGVTPHVTMGYEFGRGFSTDATFVYFDEPNSPDDYFLFAVMINAIAF